ncbi:MAG: hypothetical protein V1900_04405 [Candidatus Aenigmatarchaeota archaeon]
MGFFNRFIAGIASESMIYDMMNREPEKLGRITEYIDRHDYPWSNDREGNRIFWQTYRKMVIEPAVVRN